MFAIVCVLVVTACGSGEQTETETAGGETGETVVPDETDFFTLTIDGDQVDGSGLVFDNGGELSLRGLFGDEMDHLQLDLGADGFGDHSPTVVGPVVSRVIGLDASESSYEIVEDPNNHLSITERGPGLTVWGAFSFLAKDVASGEHVTISGRFDVPIGSGD